MTLVVDASVVLAALIDPGPVGSWAESLLVSGPLAAPHHMPVEPQRDEVPYRPHTDNGVLSRWFDAR